MAIVVIFFDLILHGAKNFVRLRKKITFFQLAIDRAPHIAANLGDSQVVLLHWLPNFRREAVNKFSPELDGAIQR